MSRTALLDVNLLVALFDPDHIHHDAAHDWFADEGSAGWASCPITESGFARVLTNPAYGGMPLRTVEVIERLRTFCKSKHHVFWPDAVSFCDRRLFNPAVILGHRQLTDIYLLGLAKHMDGRLATFDSSIPLSAVVGASDETMTVVSSA